MQTLDHIAGGLDVEVSFDLDLARAVPHRVVPRPGASVPQVMAAPRCAGGAEKIGIRPILVWQFPGLLDMALSDFLHEEVVLGFPPCLPDRVLEDLGGLCCSASLP